MSSEQERRPLVAELRELRRRKERDLDALLEHCTMLRVSSGSTREAWQDLLAFEAALRDHDRGERCTRSAWLGLGLRDPARAVREIYERFEIPYPDVFDARLKSWASENPLTRHGKWEYSLDSFGVSAAEVERHFSNYRERFGIPREAA